MKKLTEFFETMNEIVYIADLESYELIYMNRKAREFNGVASVDDIKGKKCYELFQHCSKPCAICNNSKLKTGVFYEWRYFNPHVEKTYSIKDTLIENNGKKYRLELAVDISAQERQQEMLNDYIFNEGMINDALQLALSKGNPDESIDVLIEHIGKALKSDRTYIYEYSDGLSFYHTYEWCINGVAPQKTNLQKIPRADVKSWLDKFNADNSIIIRNYQDIKNTEPVIYAYLLSMDIHSLVASPLFYENKVIGFFGVDNPPSEHLENISSILEIASHFIVSLIRRRDLFKRLENLSYLDQLTGLENRHSMNLFTSQLEVGKSVGVVYCDINGLKRMNDCEGHKAGDRLILRAGELIKSVFPDSRKFRIGGDEFLVICQLVSGDELEEKADLLRRDSDILSVGYVWRENFDGNIDKLLVEADKLMYEDKRCYYEKLKVNLNTTDD